MDNVLLKLINLSLIASLLVLAVFALRLIFRKAPKRVVCLLWALVAIRLAVPVSLESALSLIPSAEPLPANILLSEQPRINSGITVIDQAVNPILSDSFAPEPGASVNPLQVLNAVLTYVWAAGAAAMLGYAAVSSLLLKRKLRTAVPCQSGIKQSEAVPSPFVLGILRPVIYLPFGIDSGDLPLVIAHERAHIERKDHLWKPLGFLLLSVYWFNPLLWAAYIFLCRDIEAACDEKVIREMDKASLRAYSEALLHCSVKRRGIAACPIAFGEVAVKERVKNVMNYKKPAFWIILAAAFACAAAAVCFLTAPKTEYRNPREQFCIFDGGETPAEIELSAEDKQYITELLNQGDWQEGKVPSYGVDNQYRFLFQKQTVNYYSVWGAFIDQKQNKSLNLSEEEKHAMNLILGLSVPLAAGEVHSPDPKTISLSVTEDKLDTDWPHLTVCWENHGTEAFQFGGEYSVYEYRNGRYRPLLPLYHILIPAALRRVEPGGTMLATYDLKMFRFERGGSYRLYLNSAEQSDYWIDLACK